MLPIQYFKYYRLLKEINFCFIVLEQNGINGIGNKSFGANGHAIFTDLKEVPASATTEEDGEILSKLGSLSNNTKTVAKNKDPLLLTPHHAVNTGSATASNGHFK